jgi:acetyltransferase-like isoleucine patch superfamily enzyme
MKTVSAHHAERSDRAGVAEAGAARPAKPPSRLVRLVQRYLVPGFVTSAYLFLRYGCVVSSQAKVQLTSKISLGKGTVVKPFAVLIQTGAGRIIIGQNCAVSSFNHISTGDEDLIIGDNVRVGPHVTIMGASREFRDRDVKVVDQGRTHGGVVIGNDVLIGAGAVILNGHTVGEGAVIGAGCIVTRDVPSYAIVVGNPARVIGERAAHGDRHDPGAPTGQARAS